MDLPLFLQKPSAEGFLSDPALDTATIGCVAITHQATVYCRRI